MTLITPGINGQTVPGASTTQGRSRDELGQADFLELLVAQLENQDPSKPMDNFQFLSQLAQFGMVDGIQQLQGSFTDVADSFRQGQVMQAASLLGRQVETDHSSTVLGENQPVRATLHVEEAASDVVAQISDASGQTVAGVSLGFLAAGESDFIWDGVMANGEVAPPGTYNVSARGLIGGEVQELRVGALSEVTSVTVTAAGGLSVVTANGSEVSVSSLDRLQ
ncbi:MAG: flagellar hook assembly protein FlgD [Pseudomonadota bacterium]